MRRRRRRRRRRNVLSDGTPTSHAVLHRLASRAGLPLSVSPYAAETYRSHPLCCFGSRLMRACCLPPSSLRMWRRRTVLVNVTTNRTCRAAPAPISYGLATFLLSVCGGDVLFRRDANPVWGADLVQTRCFLPLRTWRRRRAISMRRHATCCAVPVHLVRTCRLLPPRSGGGLRQRAISTDDNPARQYHLVRTCKHLPPPACIGDVLLSTRRHSYLPCCSGSHLVRIRYLPPCGGGDVHPGPGLRQLYLLC